MCAVVSRTSTVQSSCLAELCCVCRQELLDSSQFRSLTLFNTARSGGPCKHTSACANFENGQQCTHSNWYIREHCTVPLQPGFQLEERAWNSFKRAVRSCIAVRSSSSVCTCFSSTSLSCCLVDGKNSLMTDAVLLALETIAGPVQIGSAAELARMCNRSGRLFYKMWASTPCYMHAFDRMRFTQFCCVCRYWCQRY